MEDRESLLAEFTFLCRHYVSGVKALQYKADIFAQMRNFQFEELADGAYAVTNAIKYFFEEVNGIRFEGENNNEH